MPTPCTLTLDLKLDDDVGTPGDMWEAFQLLARARLLPANGAKFTFVTADVEGADKLQAAIELALMDRAYGVTAELTRKTKEGLARKIAPPPPTPIDREIARSKAAKPAEVINTPNGPALLDGEAVAVLELAPALTDRIFAMLYHQGPATAAALAERLEVELGEIEARLEELRTEGRLAVDGAGIWWFNRQESDDAGASPIPL